MTVLTAVVVVLATPALVAAGTDPVPTECDRDETTGSVPKRCVGPVTDESGGGGDVLTIVIGVVVGLAVAGIAFVLVRRQLATGGRAR